MRDILFRGKKLDNGRWIYGNLIFQDDTGKYFISVSINESQKVDEEGYLFVVSCEVNPETVCQYTGLKDKNGKMIFEGDIIKSHYANAVNADFIETVVFHNGKFCAENHNGTCISWAVLADGVRHVSFDKSIYMESCEVIGNVFDNKELLNN